MITVNGEQVKFNTDFIGYDTLVELAGLTKGHVYSAKYTYPDGRSGCLIPGRLIAVEHGLRLRIVDTSGA